MNIWRGGANASALVCREKCGVRSAEYGVARYLVSEPPTQHPQHAIP